MRQARHNLGHSRGGFTLIELIVVSAMVAAVFAALLGFNNVLIRNIRDMTVEVKKGKDGPAIIRLIERDLQAAYADARMPEMFDGEGGKIGSGDAEIRFVTSRTSVLFLNGQQADLTETGYRLTESELEGTVRHYKLERREDFSMDDKPLEGGLWIPVADNIVGLQFEFYDMPEYKEGDDPIPLAALRLGDDELTAEKVWDKADRYLPFAVKVTLAVDIREGETVNDPAYEEEGIQWYTTVVRLPPFSRKLPELEGAKRNALEIRLNTAAAAPTNNTGGNNTGGNNTGGNNTGGNNTGGNNTGGNNAGGR